ncbi:conserved hypothetical protein [Leishmania mexicana MHOM/GT/2001/U1103]|uniref:Uncharacterized protein n=1 Tax=Leishmania mexicana (strain MHOM/GT/2001/U1103) TaxID=929439 RepID=E9AW76_LEIMU|nr:conserved hypothetical protein [Leishmania mexicana MHOM/GT/2001/U1103]CBZ27210.1 conserved hypothetical protein [Leishmania mexicana MHOM/GT/2001/U1103]
MPLRHHLFNRREVVAVFLDLDNATLRITDMALPAPHPSLASSGGAAASAYVPPLTRLDVVREALVAFVRAKVRSVPRTALLTFRLYVLRAGGAEERGHENGEAVVQELLVPGPAGAAGGRAMQAAIKALDPSLWGPGNSCESGAASLLPTVYTGVVRLLKRLLEAEQAQWPPADQAVMEMSKSASVNVLENSSFAHTKGAPAAMTSSDNAGLSSASPTRGGPPATAAAVNQEVCVVHGIVLRSRQGPLALPSSPVQVKVSTTSCSRDCTPTTAAPRCWLDVVSLAPLGSVAQTTLSRSSANTGSSAAAAVPHEHTPPLSTELSIDDSCACALVDPVELTGISHRGLALGPALARLISLKERGIGCLVRPPLAVVDLLAFAAAPADAGPASLLSRAGFNAGDGTTSEKRSRTSYRLDVPAAEAGTGTTAAKNITSQPAPLPQPSAPSVSSRRSEFPPVVAMRAGNGSTSVQSWGLSAPVGTTHHSLPGMPEQRGTASAAQSPLQPNRRRPITNSAATAATSAGLPSPLKILREEMKLDLAMERHGSGAADEIPSQSPESATNAPTLQLNRAATHDVCTQRRRVQTALSPSRRGSEKGPSRPQPQPPHQRPRNSGVHSGDVIASDTQAQSISAAAAHQVQCRSTPQLQSRMFPVLAQFVTPLPLTHPHPSLSQQSGCVTARHVHGVRANPGTQATDPSSGGGNDGSTKPSAAVGIGTSFNSTPPGTMANGSASSPRHPHSSVK